MKNLPGLVNIWTRCQNNREKIWDAMLLVIWVKYCQKHKKETLSSFPSSKRLEIILTTLHNEPSGEHLDIQKTLENAQKRFTGFSKKTWRLCVVNVHVCCGQWSAWLVFARETCEVIDGSQRNGEKIGEAHVENLWQNMYVLDPSVVTKGCPYG